MPRLSDPSFEPEPPDWKPKGHFVLKPPDGVEPKEFFQRPEVQVYQLFLENLSIAEDIFENPAEDENFARSQLVQLSQFIVKTDRIKSKVLANVINHEQGASELLMVQEELLESPDWKRVVESSPSSDSDKVEIEYVPFEILAPVLSTVVHDIKNVIFSLSSESNLSKASYGEAKEKLRSIVDLLTNKEVESLNADALIEILLKNTRYSEIEMNKAMVIRQKNLQDDWYEEDSSEVSSKINTDQKIENLSQKKLVCNPLYLDSLRKNAFLNAAEHAVMTRSRDGVYQAKLGVNIILDTVNIQGQEFIEIVIQDNGVGIDRDRFDFKMGVTARRDSQEEGSNTHTIMASLTQMFQGWGGDMYLRKRIDGTRGAELVTLIPVEESI